MESALFKPIELESPSDVTFFLTPPISPDGLPWRLTLLNEKNPEQVLDSIAELGGSVVVRQLKAKKYRLVVSAGEGRFRSRWHSEELRVDSDLVEHWINIPNFKIEGLVTRDGEPVEAELWFGGRHGANSIYTLTDSEGAFEGVLNREGTWDLDVSLDGRRVTSLEALEIQAPADGSPAWVEVDVPANRIFGRVVRADGRPADSTAQVLLLSYQHGKKVAGSSCDEDGNFSIEGLQSGELWISALGPEGKSAAQRVSLKPKQEQGPLELELLALQTLRGRIVTEGQPVGGVQ
ncbi:MAG: carboxypeptidase-like regulatory domain-containing protein, partial [Acidobacteriota bacterium]